MRAAIYCRISSDQSGEGAGVTRQLEDCTALVASLGWVTAETFVDNDFSASSGKVRPEYQRMIRSVEAGEIDAIVAWVPDRLYRKLRDLEPLIETMERHGTILKTVRGGEFDMGTPLGRMIARILASVSTGEGEVKADRWIRSIRQRREAGQPPGWGPRLFGYTREGEVVEKEAETVRWIVDSLIEGQSLRGVTKRLGERGSLSTLGNPWSTQAVKQLVLNPRLAGHSTLNGDTVGVGTWQAIITDETRAHVEATFAVRAGQLAPRTRVSLLLGLVRCGECGTALISGRLTKRPGETEGRRIYRCPTPPRAQGCGRIAVDAANVEDVAEAYARQRLSDPRVRERIDALIGSSGTATAEVVALEDRLRELEAELDTPGVPVTTVLRAIDRTRERIAALYAKVEIAPVTLPGPADWPDDLARRARLVRLVVEAVRVMPAPTRGRNAFDPSRVEIIER